MRKGGREGEMEGGRKGGRGGEGGREGRREGEGGRERDGEREGWGEREREGGKRIDGWKEGKRMKREEWREGGRKERTRDSMVTRFIKYLYERPPFNGGSTKSSDSERLPPFLNLIRLKKGKDNEISKHTRGSENPQDGGGMEWVTHPATSKYATGKAIQHLDGLDFYGLRLREEQIKAF